MSVNESERRFFEIIEHEQSARMESDETILQSIRKFVRLFDKYVEKPAPTPWIDLIIHGKGGHTIRLRHYTVGEGNRPLIIYFPGNAFIHDMFEVNHSIISKIAQQADCHAVMIECRLAPENPWPSQVEDALDAVNYIYKHIDKFHGDKSKIILSGYSSGANLASVVTNTLRNFPEFVVFHQYLISGGYDYTNSLHDYDAYALEDKLLDPVAAQFSFDCYAPIEQRKEPTCSPYWVPDLSGLPPTTIMVAEYDGGRSQSEGYARRLLQAGNPVEKLVLKGQTHGSIMYRKICSDGEDPAIVAGNKIRELTGRPPIPSEKITGRYNVVK